MACPRGVGSSVSVQLLAVGDLELLQHQVDARGLLGDRVLDLKARVDLQEGDQAVLTDQVFDGAGAVVVRLFADPLRRFVDLLALRVGQERRRRLLDQLLEAALQRAVAGAGDDDVAVLVGDHLRLDVAGLVEVALHEALTAAERGDRLAGGRLEQLGDLFDGAGHLHALTAAAEGGLDRDRHAVLLGEGHHLVGVLDRVGGAGHQRGLGAGGDVAGGDLVAEVADRLRAGADPDQAGVDDGLGEVGVLRQEAVAGVDRRWRRTSPPRRGACRSPGRTPRRSDRPARTPRRPGARAGRRRRARRTPPRWASPASRAARITRTAISPRLATSTLEILELA